MCRWRNIQSELNSGPAWPGITALHITAPTKPGKTGSHQILDTFAKLLPKWDFETNKHISRDPSPYSDSLWTGWRQGVRLHSNLQEAATDLIRPETPLTPLNLNDLKILNWIGSSEMCEHWTKELIRAKEQVPREINRPIVSAVFNASNKCMTTMQAVAVQCWGSLATTAPAVSTTRDQVEQR